MQPTVMAVALLGSVAVLLKTAEIRTSAQAWDNSPAASGGIGVTTDLSPSALAVTREGRFIFVACATANQIAVFDTAVDQVTDRIEVPAQPLGLAMTKNNQRLYVVCSAPASIVCEIDLKTKRILQRVATGHTSMSPVLSPDEERLYVCNRFNNDISVIDLTLGNEIRRIPVEREPVAAALTPDGKHLIVANHLHSGRANQSDAQAAVSIIDTVNCRVTKQIHLTPGACLLRGVVVSPDGRFAAVTFVRARNWLSTTSVELGRMNANALAVVDLIKFETLGVLFLDQVTRGAANPWAISWTPDGKTIAVTHAGTHEISLVDAPVEADPWSFMGLTLSEYAAYQGKDLQPPAHPVRVRQRIALPGKGPRAVAVSGSQIYVANYFSDNLCRIDLNAPEATVQAWDLAAPREPTLIRKGEQLFNDAQICFQGWQSCASCHDTDARTDALNWDLLNDGQGNPKNTKSLVWAHQTAPAMSLGVRATAGLAVRAGLHGILFSDQPEAVACAIDAYLRSLQPLPSPYLIDGKLSNSAQRGEKLFQSSRTGCAECHPAPRFTDLRMHEVGTAGPVKGLWGVTSGDNPTDRFDTPALTELWRTGPFLHDGSASNLRQILTTKNPNDWHGRTLELSEEERQYLIEYLLSL